MSNGCHLHFSMSQNCFIQQSMVTLYELLLYLYELLLSSGVVVQSKIAYYEDFVSNFYNSVHI